MNNQFQRERLCDGVHFSSVTDSKFKHNRITANLFLKLDRAAVTDNAIVPFRAAGNVRILHVSISAYVSCTARRCPATWRNSADIRSWRFRFMASMTALRLAEKRWLSRAPAC